MPQRPDTICCSTAAACQVAAAAGGRRARQLVCCSTGPTLVVLDLQRTTADGLGLLRHIAPRRGRRPIILTVGEFRGTALAAARTRREGATCSGHGARGRDRLHPAARHLALSCGGAGAHAQARQHAAGQAAAAGPSGLPTCHWPRLTEHANAADPRARSARREQQRPSRVRWTSSHDTVKLHVRHILRKLSLNSRVEAAVFAVEQRTRRTFRRRQRSGAGCDVRWVVHPVPDLGSWVVETSAPVREERMNNPACSELTAIGQEPLLVSRVLDDWSVATASQAAGVSKRTGFKWLAHFKAETRRGLADRSSRHGAVHWH